MILLTLENKWNSSSEIQFGFLTLSGENPQLKRPKSSLNSPKLQVYFQTACKVMTERDRRM
ncbi:unnamed protein product [Prunus brigantina]